MFYDNRVYYYCPRMPDAGIPTTTNIPLPEKEENDVPVRDLKHLEFIEFPGRLEILSDFVKNIAPDMSRKKSIILFVISLHNLDKQVFDENGQLILEFEKTIRILETRTEDDSRLPLVKLPILLHFTMFNAAKEKWKFYEKLGDETMQRKLKLLNIENEVVGDKFNESYTRAMKNMCRKRVGKIFHPDHVYQTSRASSFDFDRLDRDAFYMSVNDTAIIHDDVDSFASNFS